MSERQRAYRRSHESKRRMPNGCRHFSHLFVSSFPQRDGEPRRRHTLPEPNGNRAVRQRRFLRKNLDFSGFGFPPADFDAAAQFPQCCAIRYTLDVHEIRAWMSKARIGESVLRVSIVREEEKTFTVEVEPSHRVHIGWERAVIPQGAMTVLGCKLREHPVRLVKKYVA